jgi:hypothetical protein
MPEIIFDKRKASPLNIDFIDVRSSMDMALARTFWTQTQRSAPTLLQAIDSASLEFLKALALRW